MIMLQLWAEMFLRGHKLFASLQCAWSADQYNFCNILAQVNCYNSVRTWYRAARCKSMQLRFDVHPLHVGLHMVLLSVESNQVVFCAMAVCTYKLNKQDVCIPPNCISKPLCLVCVNSLKLCDVLAACITY